MNGLTISLISLLLLGGAILAGLAVLVWRHRSSEAGPELTVLLAAATVWVFGAAAEHIVSTLAAKIIATQVQYVGVLTLPAATMATVLRVIGYGRWIRPYLTLAAPLALAGIGVAATNAWHGAVWRSVVLESTSGLAHMTVVAYGPAYALISLSAHAQLAAAFLLYLHGSWKRWQADTTLTAVGFLAPWLANVAYQLRLGPWPDVDLTPLGLVVTGVSFAISFNGVGWVLSTVKLAHRDILDHIADLVLVVDPLARVLTANRAAHEVFDLPPLPALAEDALGDHAELLRIVVGAETERRRDVEIAIDGAQRVFELNSVPVSSSGAPTEGRVYVLRDVTERRVAERRERTHREQLRQIIDLIPHPVYAKDASARWIFVNEALARRYKSTPAEMVGRPIMEFHKDPAEFASIHANDLEIIETRTPYTTEETLSNGGDREFVFRTTKLPFFRDDSETPAVVGISIDVSQERERERLLESLASTDSLTSLTNRRSFQEILARALESARQRSERAALLFIDLDRFKMVNDIYGHLAGDEVIRQVADRVQESIRFNDALWHRQGRTGPSSTVSRFGGDEFIVLLPRIESPESSALVARRLLDALDAPFQVDDDRLQLGASIGVAVFPEDGPDAETLLRHCDQALTSAKRTGRGHFEFFNRHIGAADERRHALEKGLRNALETDELSMVYQPIRAIGSAHLVGAEALLRWESPELGPVSPEEFIPIVEDSGLIVPIGLRVIRSVCEDMAGWQEGHLRLPRVSINLSARQLVDAESAEAVAAIFRQTGIHGGQVEFELTEGSILAQTPVVERTLTDLRALGATFALDDFGTGYSSLSHLRRFNFQRLKIDRTFVAGIGSSRDDEQLARAVIALARQLDLETVAEGVETEEQLHFLRREGCDCAQGFLIGRPMSADRFRALLESEKDEDA